jgi:hypothetical protein
MPPFLHFHALAAPRGDGLRPELLALFERHAAARKPDLTMAELDRHLADALARPHCTRDEAAAAPEKPARDMALGVVETEGHVPSAGL